MSSRKVASSSGRTVRLPLPASQAGYQVLGRRGGEWVVATPGYDGEVLAVRGRHVRTVSSLPMVVWRASLTLSVWFFEIDVC